MSKYLSLAHKQARDVLDYDRDMNQARYTLNRKAVRLNDESFRQPTKMEQRVGMKITIYFTELIKALDYANSSDDPRSMTGVVDAYVDLVNKLREYKAQSSFDQRDISEIEHRFDALLQPLSMLLIHAEDLGWRRTDDIEHMSELIADRVYIPLKDDPDIVGRDAMPNLNRRAQFSFTDRTKPATAAEINAVITRNRLASSADMMAAVSTLHPATAADINAAFDRIRPGIAADILAAVSTIQQPATAADLNAALARIQPATAVQVMNIMETLLNEAPRPATAADIQALLLAVIPGAVPAGAPDVVPIVPADALPAVAPDIIPVIPAVIAAEATPGFLQRVATYLFPDGPFAWTEASPVPSEYGTPTGTPTASPQPSPPSSPRLPRARVPILQPADFQAIAYLNPEVIDSLNAAISRLSLEKAVDVLAAVATLQPENAEQMGDLLLNITTRNTPAYPDAYTTLEAEANRQGIDLTDYVNSLVGAEDVGNSAVQRSPSPQPREATPRSASSRSASLRAASLAATPPPAENLGDPNVRATPQLEEEEIYEDAEPGVQYFVDRTPTPPPPPAAAAPAPNSRMNTKEELWTVCQSLRRENGIATNGTAYPNRPQFMRLTAQGRENVIRALDSGNTRGIVFGRGKEGGFSFTSMLGDIAKKTIGDKINKMYGGYSAAEGEQGMRQGQSEGFIRGLSSKKTYNAADGLTRVERRHKELDWKGFKLMLKARKKIIKRGDEPSYDDRTRFLFQHEVDESPEGELTNAATPAKVKSLIMKDLKK